MAIRDTFRVGDRVKPSRKAVRMFWPRHDRPSGGVVVSRTRIPKFAVRIRWDGRKTATRYHKSFIAHDKEQRR